MRKLYIAAFLLLGITLGSTKSGFAQFEGIVSYDISYKTDDEKMKNYVDGFPTQSILHIKNEKMRFDQALMGGGNQSIITNTETKATTLLMNILGSEFQVNLSSDEMGQLKQIEKLRIEKTDQTKNIAGYDCKHAYAISSTDTMSVYYTEKIQMGAIIPQFQELEGLPLSYEIYRGKVHMEYNCNFVEIADVPDVKFTVSQKVREIPFKDFASSFAMTKE